VKIQVINEIVFFFPADFGSSIVLFQSNSIMDSGSVDQGYQGCTHPLDVTSEATQQPFWTSVANGNMELNFCPEPSPHNKTSDNVRYFLLPKWG